SIGQCADLHQRRYAPRDSVTNAESVPGPRSCLDKVRSASASLRRKVPSLLRTRRPRVGGESHRSNALRWRAEENVREFLRGRGSVADLQLPREYRSSSIADCRSECKRKRWNLCRNGTENS